MLKRFPFRPTWLAKTWPGGTEMFLVLNIASPNEQEAQIPA